MQVAQTIYKQIMQNTPNAKMKKYILRSKVEKKIKKEWTDNDHHYWLYMCY